MPKDVLRRIAESYHEAGHGTVAESLDYSAEISLGGSTTHLDPSAIVHPAPTEPKHLALIAMAGPVAEALAMNNWEQPAARDVPIFLSNDTRDLFVEFAETVLAFRAQKKRETVSLSFEMMDKTRHSVLVAFEDYEYLPEEWDAGEIADSIRDAVSTVQDNWVHVARIAGILELCNSYSTQQYRNLPPDKQ